jgi:hypothetical protein
MTNDLPSWARGEPTAPGLIPPQAKSVLSKAGLPSEPHVLTKADGVKVGVLSGAQYHALASAGVRLSAQATSDGVWVIEEGS